MTPLCSYCDNTHDKCHFCRGLTRCRPPLWREGEEAANGEVASKEAVNEKAGNEAA